MTEQQKKEFMVKLLDEFKLEVLDLIDLGFADDTDHFEFLEHALEHFRLMKEEE